MDLAKICISKMVVWRTFVARLVKPIVHPNFQSPNFSTSLLKLNMPQFRQLDFIPWKRQICTGRLAVCMGRADWVFDRLEGLDLLGGLGFSWSGVWVFCLRGLGFRYRPIHSRLVHWWKSILSWGKLENVSYQLLVFFAPSSLKNAVSIQLFRSWRKLLFH